MLNSNNYIEYKPDAETVSLVKRYERVINRQSSDYFDEEEFEMIIDHYLNLNNIEEAMGAADRGSTQYPYSSELKLYYAGVLVIQGQALRAFQILTQVEQMGVNDSGIHFLKARVYVQLGKVRDALPCFDKCLQLEEQSDEREKIRLVVANSLIDAQEYMLALRYLNQALKSAPQNESILCDIAYCYEQLNDMESSKKYNEQCISINPFNELAWYNLGTIFDRMQDYEKALQAFEFTLAVNDNNTSALFNKATMFIRMERFQEAIDSFYEFLNFEPDNVPALCAIAECYEGINHQESAFLYYSQVLEIDPEYPDAWYGKGILLMNRQEYEQSFAHMQSALRIDPENAEYYYGLGVLFLRMHDESMAVQSFKHAVALNPHDTESWLILAELATSTGFAEALEILRQAYNYNPAVASISFKMAAVHFTLKEMDMCLACLSRALSMDESDDEFLDICPTAINNEQIRELYAHHNKFL